MAANAATGKANKKPIATITANAIMSKTISNPKNRDL